MSGSVRLELCGCLLAVILAMPGWAETRAVVTAGLGGDPDYEAEFQRHANRLADGLETVSGDVTLLVGDTADTAAVRTALEAVGGRMTSSDTLLFVYVGHGSWDGEHFKFNVPGRDFTATDLTGWLDAAGGKRQVVVATGASSGALQEVMAADHRTVMTATRSGEQRNATVFGRFFTAALGDDAADLDKDKRVSVIEAFRYAESRVADYYTREGEMTVEHPVTSGPEPVLALALLEEQPTTVSLISEHLYAQREELELDIAWLRANKDEYTQDDYFLALQALLLELAAVEKQIEAEAEAGAPGGDTP